MTDRDEIRQLLRDSVNLPAEEQGTVLRHHLKSCAMEDPVTRARLVRILLEIAHELTSAQRREHAKARTSAFSRFPMGTRMALLGAYRDVLSRLPADRAEQEKVTLASILPELRGADRATARRFLDYLPRGAEPLIGE